MMVMIFFLILVLRLCYFFIFALLTFVFSSFTVVAFLCLSTFRAVFPK